MCDHHIIGAFVFFPKEEEGRGVHVTATTTTLSAMIVLSFYFQAEEVGVKERECQPEIRINTLLFVCWLPWETGLHQNTMNDAFHIVVVVVLL